MRPTAFDFNAARRIAAATRQLEGTPQNRPPKPKPARYQQGRQWFFGYTTESHPDHTTYPTSGTTFPIELFDLTFDNSTVGSGSADATGRGRYIVAKNFRCNYLEAGTLVFCFRVPTGLAHRDGPRWWCLPIGEVTMASATLTEDMCPTDESVGVSDFTPYNSCTGVPDPEVDTVQNPNDMVGCEGSTVVLARDGDSWNVISVQPTRMVMTENVTYSSCTLSVQQSAIYGYTCDATCGPEGVSNSPVMAATSVNVATGLEVESSGGGASCGLRLKVTPGCLIGAGTETDGDLVPFSNVEALTDLTWDNPDIDGTLVEFWALCVQSPTTEALITAVDCETGSS
jgi:hypothetical protein